jgi:phage-related protein
MDFPLDHNSQGWDSTLYQVERENQAITTEMEGGYMCSRPRHTRTPRKTFTLGWQNLSNTDYATLSAFWDSHFGASKTFTWTDPPTGTLYTVRFKAKDGFIAKYLGKRALRIWQVTVVLEQV